MAASRRRLLHVQRGGDIGLPRASGSTSAFRSSSNLGFVCVSDLRPPPSRRIRLGVGGGGASSSFRPRPIVLAAMRVTRETAAIPPCPAARASAAAKSRRCRSSNCGNIAELRCRSFWSESSSIIQKDRPPRHRGESLSLACKPNSIQLLSDELYAVAAASSPARRLRHIAVEVA